MKPFIKWIVPLSVISLTLACSIGLPVSDQPPVINPATEPPAGTQPPVGVDYVEILSVTPPLENGLSVTDTGISAAVRYNLTSGTGSLQMWFERYRDELCTVSGIDPTGSTSLNGGTVQAVSAGEQEITLSSEMPNLDTEFVGVGVRLWNTDNSLILAEDTDFSFCYRVNPATP